MNTMSDTAANTTKMTKEAPWFHYRKALNELFKYDEKIHVRELVENEGAKEGCQYILNIDAYGKLKSQALQKVLPHIAEFGNIKVAINIIVHEENLDDNPKKIYEALFAGNNRFKEVLTATDFAGTEHYFITFTPHIIQFLDDDTSDPYGNYTTLAHEVAKESFIARPDIHFCIEKFFDAEKKGENVNKPLGEWP